MNAFVYSASQNAFWYADSPSRPKDAVDINLDVFEEFAITPVGDKRRVAGEDGLPSWEDIPPPTAAEIKAKAIAEAEQKKSQLLAEASDVTKGWQTDLMLGIISDDDKETFIIWRKYIQALDSIDTSFAPEIEWPTMP
ncbi:tail fiber assembly protein [Citrobacter braakii]|uniref:tail fiber assembly protein n=1 Tax=Citrobacter braakii TaxID=57706 RepID=UPI0025A277B0|nr:tail fiber assembly protein [Citrobacter braakii]MDM6729850.1 tail fiber assembly protein [Citrobacter braakii]